MSLVNADGAKMLAADDGKSPILVAPIGKDCTTTAVELGLDPKRTVAVDLTGDVSKRITIMMAPGFDPAIRDATVALLAKSGTKVTVIKDSPGFIAQRMCSMIANLGCEMAMIGIASAADVDTAMTLGLNYPRGPLALADWLGVKECHEILVEIQAITGDDRYRPASGCAAARCWASARRRSNSDRQGTGPPNRRSIPCNLLAGECDDEAEQMDGGRWGRPILPDRRWRAGTTIEERKPARRHAAGLQGRL